ncbi:MAG: glycosyltransferase [Myxococcales bacterium]|jgi:serine acetyltransferase/GT2 family glycosyltransferase|nr:glycosyltransferase [Myxococcales bacterium]
MLPRTAEEFLGDGVVASVVVANYNRPDLVKRLLGDLAAQSFSPTRFEVVVVDDGSKIDVRTVLDPKAYPFSLVVHRQENAGAAKARQRGAELAQGKVVVFLDDDMRVGQGFLEGHLAHHEKPGTVVLGQLRPDADIASMPLFEKFFARMLSNKADELLAGRAKLRGHGVYTGNVSVDRELFLRVGGFDPAFRALEDEELGIRLEKAGATLLFSDKGESIHGSDKTEVEKWLARSQNDGKYAVRVGRKHRDVADASPFRHIAHISPVSMPFLGLGLGLPKLAEPIAKLAVTAAIGADKLGLERLAVAGATLVYGIQFYRGVREESGSLGGVVAEYKAFREALRDVKNDGSGGASPGEATYASFVAAVREDHAVMRAYQGKYGQGEGGGGSLPADSVKKIGLQILVAYRLMRLFRARGNLLAAQFTSRLMRHLYASDIHWDAELAPGVMIVHGFGLAISHSAKVARGSILFQHVTLGYGLDAEGKTAGAPTLEENVHVGVGATLYGPITVGASSKIMAGCVLSESVPPRSLVAAPKPDVTARKARP